MFVNGLCHLRFLTLHSGIFPSYNPLKLRKFSHHPGDQIRLTE